MKKTLIEVVILLFVTSFIIFFQFNHIPKKLSWDEVEFTRLALSLANKPYISYSQLATGHSTLYFYIILCSFMFFGITNFALRFPAALFGVANVIVFYFTVRLVFSKVKYFSSNFFHENIPIFKFTYNSLIPLFLSLVFASSRWYFNFARFSFEATFLLFLELMSLFFFLSFLADTHNRTQKNKLTLNLTL